MAFWHRKFHILRMRTTDEVDMDIDRMNNAIPNRKPRHMGYPNATSIPDCQARLEGERG